MVTKTKSKRQQSIKSKLIAAVCMLLVSTIMMVSSTYAWFTLSTAPEVTGITTSVGANGNLEMALLPLDGDAAKITSEAGDSTKDVKDRNVTWGNLVDLSDSDVYGLDKIVLYPAALNAATTGEDGNALTLEETLLKTPAYGADGRVSELLKNTVTSTYDATEDNFPNNTNFGVRAVGTASGMTDRQLDYRNARSAANTAAAQAKTEASRSLNVNGSALANIAIKHGIGGTSESYDKTDVASLRAIIDDLKGTETKDGALDYIETAYMQYILAYAASAASGTEDTVWQAVKGAIEAENASLASVINTLGTVPAEINTAITAYNGTVADVSEADTKLAVLETTLASNENATFTWDQISTAMHPLADTSKMLINGFAASQVKDNLGPLVSSVTANGGLTVSMASGAGVYADIADQCGDYEASVTIEEVEYNGITLNNMIAKMKTESNLAPNNNYYLTAISAVVNAAGAPASAEGKTLPITDMFGYVIDLAFRTNAAESNLLLQTDAVDRIYSDGGSGESMGHGATMSFKATTTGFSNAQILELMNAIRIEFYDPGSKVVLAHAKLDVTDTSIDAEAGIVAPIKLYTGKPSGTTTTTTYGKVAAGTPYDKTLSYCTLTTAATTNYVAASVEDYIAGTQLYKKAADADTYTAMEKFDASKTYYTYTAGAAEGEGTYAAVADEAALKTAITNKTQLYRANADGSGYTAFTVTFDAANAYTKTEVEAVYADWKPTKTDAAELAAEFEAAVTSGLYIKTVTTTDAEVNYLTGTSAVITALTQNTPHKVSVLVYLDGEKITNKDVAASASTSVVGSMNLQFASSATLVPMDYTPLMNQTGSSDNEEEDTPAASATKMTAATATGATLSGDVTFVDKTITFKLTDGTNELNTGNVSVKFGESETVNASYSNGAWTATAATTTLAADTAVAITYAAAG